MALVCCAAVRACPAVEFDGRRRTLCYLSWLGGLSVRPVEPGMCQPPSVKSIICMTEWLD